jgi:hypothetical protein
MLKFGKNQTKLASADSQKLFPVFSIIATQTSLIYFISLTKCDYLYMYHRVGIKL